MKYNNADMVNYFKELLIMNEAELGVFFNNKENPLSLRLIAKEMTTPVGFKVIESLFDKIQKFK